LRKPNLLHQLIDHKENEVYNHGGTIDLLEPRGIGSVRAAPNSVSV
jgi:hypothetical protein